MAPDLMRRKVVELRDVADEDDDHSGDENDSRQEGVSRILFQDEVQVEPQVDDHEDDRQHDRQQLNVQMNEEEADQSEDEDQLEEEDEAQPPARGKIPGVLRSIRNFCTPGDKDIVATEGRARLRSKEKEIREEQDT